MPNKNIKVLVNKGKIFFEAQKLRLSVKALKFVTKKT